MSEFDVQNSVSREDLAGAVMNLRLKSETMKKALIISARPRKDANSDILCDEFAENRRE